MKKLKTAIIGCGARSDAHAQAALAGSGLEIVYAFDLIAERAEQRAKEWSAKPCTDYQTVLADENVEAVIVVTNVETHVPIARDALEAGKHVIVEKPLGDDLGSARELAALARNSGLVGYVSYQLRFAAGRAGIREAMDAIDPVQIFMEHQRGMMKPQFLNASPLCGIVDCCAHDFDQILWMMGRPPIAVTASLRRNTFTPDTGAADALSALIEFGDGRSAVVFAGLGAREVGRRLHVVGACGNIVAEPGEEPVGVTFTRYGSQGEKAAINFAEDDELAGDAALQAAFAEEIRTGRRSHAARIEDGLNSLLVTLGCLKSAEEGRRVLLDELLQLPAGQQGEGLDEHC
jgi:predicted dehydrogenase